MTSNSHKCEHCGLRFAGRVVTDDVHDSAKSDAVFCCTGCRAVYHALHDAGLDDFYTLRQSWSAAQARPVDEEVFERDDATFFDSQSFLADHGTELDDGTLRVEMHLDGVHCAGCVWLVERMPRLVEGVVEARLELSRRKVTIRFNPDAVKLSQIASWLARFGFELNPLQTQDIRRRSDSSKSMLIRLGICWAVAANVMLMTIAIYAGLDPVKEPGLHAAVLWSTFALSAVSLVAGGTVFFRRAWASFRAGRLSMDVPISLGILVGWSHSGWSTITGSGEVWFDSIVVLIAALLTARYLQIRGSDLAADAAARLLALLPQVARKVVPEGGGETVEIVPANSLQCGDHLRVHAGDVVPADGLVLTGTSDVSRAVLTGESRPEKITTGDLVEAGTTNLSSPIDLQVTAVAESTRVGKLLEWIETRQKRRAPIVQLADRLGGHFIALVLFAAIATAVAWSMIDPSRAVFNVVALLVIACPCALGMATPLALTVGVGQAARRGIYVKHDDVIEALCGVTDIVFDKTGTLTYGRPAVIDTFGDRRAAARACALESHSSHPIARALLRWSKDETDIDPDQLQVSNVTETPGAGIAGRIGGQSVRVGRLSWFDDIPDDAMEWARVRAERGLTPVAIGIDGRITSVLAIGDRLRDDAPEILGDFRDRGIRVHLLSGDHPSVVDAAGQSLGLAPSRIHGGVTPELKLEYIQTLRTSSGPVAMVGDGVNDAAALQAADVGIAVAGGAEASLVAADVFIVNRGLRPVSELLNGARRVMRVVHRNLTGSGAYNLFGISLAALGFITPLAAAVLMPISSLAVVASSLVQNSFSEDIA